MTDGVKSSKDTLFFLANESEEEKEKKPKKPPVAPIKNGSPVKQKSVGGKVLRNQTRRAAQDEVHQTALAKLLQHQKELHQNLQAEGLAKFSEDGMGASGKEGKGWKKFQSYKGEGALPAEIEKLRVWSCFSEGAPLLIGILRSLSIVRLRLSFCRCMDLQSHSILTQ